MGNLPSVILSLLAAAAFQSPDTCLAFVSRNLARGNGNFYTYVAISKQPLRFQKGDFLVYDVFLDPKNPVAKGGIEIEVNEGSGLRDAGDGKTPDQNGLRSHGDSVLSLAIGKWYERRIPLDVLEGQNAREWSMVFEGDQDGRYAQFLDNIRVEHATGKPTIIYDNGTPALRQISINNGYTKRPAVASVERAKVATDSESLIAVVVRKAEQLWKLDALREDLDLVKRFEEKNPEPHLRGHIQNADRVMKQLEAREEVAPEDVQAALHLVNEALAHAHPVMAKYTGHLVGHAHIDLQWLWEWQEGLVATRDTFVQALKFMDEMPAFTFSQSSSWLYQAIEETYPDLFRQIQAKVKKGQWEIVGGRVCEGDTNLISPESHVRHFLYGQAYFREKFGKIATVGWEPDTFGHTVQMPQILKLSGCEDYYFCRGGLGKPVFWWESPDGSRVLAFDEPATGSWYNADIGNYMFGEMLDFEKSTSSRESLLVYGVGNHGGGPTREHLKTALELMKNKNLPKIKFSTASDFFKALRKNDLSKAPVVKQELNPVFDGCYTSHAEVKRSNRDAEAWTSSAEAASAAASLFGFKYPKPLFRRMWEDITYNHHHDTLPGSGIHAPYEKTTTMLSRVVAEAKDTAMRALETMSVRVTPKKGGLSVLVFNPTGFTRSAWVETTLVKSGWDSGIPLDPANCEAVAPDRSRHPVELLDTISKRARFWAAGVPPYGYRVFHIANATLGAVRANAVTFSEAGLVQNGLITAEFDLEQGCIKSVSRGGIQVAGQLGKLELHFEKPGDMSAWTIGKIDRLEGLRPKSHTLLPDGVRFLFETPSAGGRAPTTYSATYRLNPNEDHLSLQVTTHWNHIGGGQDLSPLLRLAFDSGGKLPLADVEVPFAVQRRESNGIEMPGLRWAYLTNDKEGLAIANDAVHGYSVKDGVLRYSLIRSSYNPDPVPNPGQHEWNFTLSPQTGTWSEIEMPRIADELNQKLMTATVPFDAQGSEAHEWSAAKVDGGIPTGLKMAEDSEDLIVRFVAIGHHAAVAADRSCGKIELPVEKVRFPFLPGAITSVDFLERPIAKHKPAEALELSEPNWRIVSLRFGPKRVNSRRP